MMSSVYNLVYKWLAIYFHAISDHFILLSHVFVGFFIRCTACFFSDSFAFFSFLLLVPVREVFYAFVILIQIHVSCQKLTGMEEKRGREGIWLSMLGR